MQLRRIALAAKLHATHVVPSFLLEGEGARDNNDGANGKSDRCRHNAPALPDDLCRNDACRPR